MTNPHYARVNLRPESANLLDAAIKESDPRFNDHLNVMGTDFFAEVHASAEARDASLGPVNSYIEFVPASAAEVDEAEIQLCTMAIGPALGDPGFEEVANPILGAILDFNRDVFDDRNGSFEVKIARTQYSIHITDKGRVSVSWHPLYADDSGDLEEQTATWVSGYFTGRFGALAA